MFSTAAFAAELGLVNIGAAGTFVSRGPITAAAIGRALPFETQIAIRPARELVDAGPPAIPAGAQIFVSVLIGAATKRPTLPIEQHRGLDLSAVLARAYGIPFTTRGWATMVRIAAAIREL